MMRTALAAIGLSAGLLAGHAFADPAACAAVDAANAKLAQLPYHMTIGETGGPTGPIQAEGFVIGGFRYLQFQEKWIKKPWAPSKMKLVDSARTTCEAAGSEAVGTEPAVIYSVHTVEEQGTADKRIWISVSRGLPLRAVAVMNGPELTGYTAELCFDYENIRAPS